MTGLVCSSSGTSASVSTTKNASPASPTFIQTGARCPFSLDRLSGSVKVTYAMLHSI